MGLFRKNNSTLNTGNSETAAAAENNPFLDSLNNATVEDLIGGKYDNRGDIKKKRQRRISNFISSVFGIACLCVFLYCAFRIAIIVNGYRVSDSLYGSIADEYRRAVSGSTEVSLDNLASDTKLTGMKSYAEILSSGADVYEEIGQDEKKYVSEKFMNTLGLLEKWKAKNSDIYGYIEIPEDPVSRISFPIVQTDNNEYYLNHSSERKFLTAGAIYADFRASTTLTENRNLIIYGHNLSNQGMFHFLVNFLSSDDYFQTHDIIISTFDGIYTFSVFSAYETTSTGRYVQMYFADDQSFIDWCLEEESNSKYHRESISFDKDSVVVTLSTCINGTTNGRIAIHGILTEIEN